MWLPRGRGGRGNDWEFGISRCILLYIKQINNKVLLYRTGNYNQYPVISHIRKEYEGRAEPQTGGTTREGAEAQNHSDHENSGSWSLTEMLKKDLHLTQGMGEGICGNLS